MVQSDHRVRLPRIFFTVDRQDAREQLDFVAEQFQNECPGKEGWIHEHAFAERQGKRHLSSLIKHRRHIKGRSGHAVKFHLHIRNVKLRLVDNQGWNTNVVGKGHPPGSVPCTAALDAGVKRHVQHERDQEGKNEMLQGRQRFQSGKI